MLEPLEQWLKNHGCLLIQSDLNVLLSTYQWHNNGFGFVIDSDDVVSRGVVTLNKTLNNR